MKRMLLILGLISCVSLFVSVTGGFGGRETLAGGNGKDYAAMANNLAQLLSSIRLFIARNVDVINTHEARLGEPIPEGGLVSYKGIVPAIVGRLVADEFMVRTGISLKQITLGKGRIGPRNVYNKPDPWERAVFRKFNSRSYPTGVGFGEFTNLEESQGLVYRYMLPLYIEKPCMKCHGDPSTSPTGDGKDITGYPMEGYKEGELRGAISVVIPYREVQTSSVNSRFFLDLEEPQEAPKTKGPTK